MNENLELITCSYWAELKACQRMCASVDQYVPDSIRHTLIVPARDHDLFRSLATHRRRVLATQDIVPAGFRQLPVGGKAWFDAEGHPIRGPIMREVTKLSTNHATEAELLMFVDSDLVFAQAFDPSSVYADGKLRLYRKPADIKQMQSLRRHIRTNVLLGLSHQRIGERHPGSFYCGRMITWRNSQVVALHAHLQAIHEKSWYLSVSRSLDISAYSLYGTFVECVVGEPNHGHYYSDEALCHRPELTCENEQLLHGERLLQPETLPVLMQSTRQRAHA